MPAHRRDSARLHLPSATSRGCIFMAAERDTRGIALDDEQRFNYYPATPFPMISWIFEGALHLVEDPGASGTPSLGGPLPRVVFSGPRRRPSASWSPGPVHVLSVAVTPGAVRDLLGVKPEHVLDTIVAIEEVASGPIVDRLRAVAATDSSGAFAAVEELLAAEWSGVRADHRLASVREWVQSVVVQAAFTRPGAGVRQIQRRLRAWTGQSHQELERYARLEDVMARVATYPDGARLDLADLAASAGYADQSHLGREVRRSTGVSPGRLEALIDSEEGFWFYRLLLSHVGLSSRRADRLSEHVGDLAEVAGVVGPAAAVASLVIASLP